MRPEYEHEMMREHAVSAASKAELALSRGDWAEAIYSLEEAMLVAKQCLKVADFKTQEEAP